MFLYNTYNFKDNQMSKNENAGHSPDFKSKESYIYLFNEQSMLMLSNANAKEPYLKCA